MIFGKICPYCKERIKKNAVICRYCHKELEPGNDDSHGSSLWLLTGFIGLLLGAAAALGIGYVDERRRWDADTAEVQFKDHKDPCE